MQANAVKISAIPTNIITGFLGVGKTSAILQLLKHKPSNERWAVLVNEFGEIGVDGSLIAGQYSETQEIYIKEVPGGCMCCAAGLPMQIALNQLLARAKPHRLLIEPTGLGHPVEVLEVLSSDTYRDIISLQKTITLVDARKLIDERYTQHQTFNQQIAMADVIIGNKQDLYQANHKDRLRNYVNKHGQTNAQIDFTAFGNINPSMLYGLSSFQSRKPCHTHKTQATKQVTAEETMPESGYLKAINQGEGYQSLGWRFSPDKVFNHQKLVTLLSGLNVERMKAVFITNQGVIGFNLADKVLTQVELDDCIESRIELIHHDLDEAIEAELLTCID